MFRDHKTAEVNGFSQFPPLQHANRFYCQMINRLISFHSIAFFRLRPGQQQSTKQSTVFASMILDFMHNKCKHKIFSN